MLKNALLKSVTFVMVMILLLSSVMGRKAQDGTVTGSMAVDCSTLSGEALQYAQNNDICPRSGGTIAGGVTGAGTGTETGNCGTVSLTIHGVGDGLDADMSARVVSTAGIITHVSYNIAWRNNDSGVVGSVHGGTPVHASTVYQSPHHLVNTGGGIIRGTLNGLATINALFQCVFKPTNAYAIVHL